jgi:hypothetical protein
VASGLHVGKLEAATGGPGARIEPDPVDFLSFLSVDPARIEERTLLPVHSSVSILRYDLPWVH